MTNSDADLDPLWQDLDWYVMWCPYFSVNYRDASCGLACLRREVAALLSRLVSYDDKAGSATLLLHVSQSRDDMILTADTIYDIHY